MKIRVVDRQLLAVALFVSGAAFAEQAAAPCTAQQLKAYSEEYDWLIHRQLWGEDNRHEYGEETDPAVLANASGVAIIMSRDALNDRPNKVPRYVLSSRSTFGEGERKQEIGPDGNECTANKAVCDGPYLNQLTPGWCTAFLVSDTEIATAKHCVEKRDLDTRPYAVFGFYVSQAGETRIRFADAYVYELDATNIRRCEGDCAIVRLKIPPGRKVPSIFRRLVLQHEVTTTDKFYVIGHPNGLPLKIAGDGVIKGKIEPESFQATLDTFHGNSGSPVFSVATNRVVGILTGGEPDFKLLRMKGTNAYCWALATAKPNDPGEFVTRVTQLPLPQ